MFFIFIQVFVCGKIIKTVLSGIEIRRHLKE